MICARLTVQVARTLRFTANFCKAPTYGVPFNSCGWCHLDLLITLIAVWLSPISQGRDLLFGQD